MSGGNERSVAFHHAVWRWHFYAGLLSAPVVVALTATGALYLFNREIESWWYYDRMHVEPVHDGSSPSMQEAAVLAVYPGASVARFVLPETPDAAAEWAIKLKDGRRLDVFVDPSNAAVTGSVNADWRLMDVIRQIHAGLFLGDFGKYLVELAACWAFVLLATGLFLWWPRGTRGAAALLPRLGASGRTFWRDLHAVPSLWNAPLVGFLILSGLPWSIFWGNQVAKLGTLSSVTAPSPNFSDQPLVPAAQATEVHSHHHEAADQPWTIRHAPEPVVSASPSVVGIDRVLHEARIRGIDAPGLRVLYPQAPGETFVLSYVPATAQGQRTVNIDPGTGAIVRDVGWSAYSPLGKAVEFGVMTHMGQQFGAINKYIMLACCLLLIATVGAGVTMWWKRRPPGSLAPPPLPADKRAVWTVAAIVCVAGLFFPLLGASLVAVLGVDAIAQRLSQRPKHEDPR